MAVEIERKFLVRGSAWRGMVPRSGEESIVQGYMDGGVRVRTVDDYMAFLTIKGETKGISRLEYEYQIPIGDAREMLAELCVGGKIEKTRYRVRHGGHIWEIDEFHGANEGLLLAEVELESESEEVQIPTWVGQEVSEDPRYYNAHIAKYGSQN